MKRSTRSPFGNPMLAWLDLAWKIGEMSMASAQVITHRAARIAAAGPWPNARDRKEFARMGSEKVEAAAASGQAMAGQVAMMNLAFGARALKDWGAANMGLWSLATSRNVEQFAARQAALARIFARSSTAASTLSETTARVARRGLAPIHARATANARRLGRR